MQPGHSHRSKPFVNLPRTRKSQKSLPWSGLCGVLMVLGVAPVLASAAEPAVHRTAVVAHRGLMRHAPENTLAAFRTCLELGFGFELDIRRSREGTLVCVHDDTLDRTTDGSGPVTAMPLAQLLKLDAGSWFDTQFAGHKVPTIEQIYALIAEYAAAGRMENVVIAVDIKAKDDRIEADLARLAAKYKLQPHLLYIGRTIVESTVRQRLKAADARSITARLCGSPAEVEAALSSRDTDWVYLRFLPSPALVRQAHEAGRRVFLAGVKVAGNQQQNWQSAWNAKADAVLTDYPLVFRQLQRTTATATSGKPNSGE